MSKSASTSASTSNPPPNASTSTSSNVPSSSIPHHFLSPRAAPTQPPVVGTGNTYPLHPPAPIPYALRAKRAQLLTLPSPSSSLSSRPSHPTTSASTLHRPASNVSVVPVTVSREDDSRDATGRKKGPGMEPTAVLGMEGEGREEEEEEESRSDNGSSINDNDKRATAPFPGSSQDSNASTQPDTDDPSTPVSATPRRSVANSNANHSVASVRKEPSLPSSVLSKQPSLPSSVLSKQPSYLSSSAYSGGTGEGGTPDASGSGSGSLSGGGISREPSYLLPLISSHHPLSASTSFSRSMLQPLQSTDSTATLIAGVPGGGGGSRVAGSGVGSLGLGMGRDDSLVGMGGMGAGRMMSLGELDGLDWGGGGKSTTDVSRL
ncbi:hypothetical protein BT69DRAFT_1334520 [Atractiella rhizophila]|nr:hypothetical protein BT69DRAFT_1334520 [Atractiella rhizophila]